MSTGFDVTASRAVRVALGAALAATLVACADEPGQSTQPSAAAPSVADSVAPSESAEPVGQFLFIDVDTVLGPANLTDEEKPSKSCVQFSRFGHNEQVVWRIRVVDPLNGEELGDAESGAPIWLESLEVVMPDQTFDLHYGPHPRDNPIDNFWTTSWTVPEGYPDGVINYTVVATASDGRTGTWEQFQVASANLTITADVRPVIAQ